MKIIRRQSFEREQRTSHKVVLKGGDQSMPSDQTVAKSPIYFMNTLALEYSATSLQLISNRLVTGRQQMAVPASTIEALRVLMWNGPFKGVQNELYITT